MGANASLCVPLRREREALGLTQAGLASAVGLSPETIRKYEGGTRTPTREHLVAMLGSLKVPRVRARTILAAAGFDAGSGQLPVDALSGYYMTLPEAHAEIEATPWPQFIVGDAMELVTANRAASLLWGVDVAAELKVRSRVQLHLMALLAEPQFSGRIVNFDECLAIAVGVLKGVHSGGESLDTPSPWAEQVLAQLAVNDPTVVARLLRAWDSTPARPPKSRWTYRLIWREPEGELRFSGIVSTASEPDGLSFHDWIPADAASYAALERVLAARAASDAPAVRAYRSTVAARRRARA